MQSLYLQKMVGPYYLSFYSFVQNLFPTFLGLMSDVKCATLFRTVPPKIELAIQMKKMQPKKAGSDLCLEADVFGKPMPKVTWTKDGKELTDKDIKTSQKRHKFFLSFPPITRLHTGVYTIHAKNASGSKSEDITLTVLGES